MNMLRSAVSMVLLRIPAGVPAINIKINATGRLDLVTPSLVWATVEATLTLAKSRLRPLHFIGGAWVLWPMTTNCYIDRCHRWKGEPQ